jgi:hypothetical protein
VGDLATAISNKTGVDDEAIQSASNLLLTFTKVRNEVGKGNDVFDQATQAAVDMAAVLGGDASSQAKLLGKALNDPIKGLSALSRAGVSFTAEQKEQIKTLRRGGRRPLARRRSFCRSLVPSSAARRRLPPTRCSVSARSRATSARTSALCCCRPSRPLRTSLRTI